jgi:hypothetical protein
VIIKVYYDLFRKLLSVGSLLTRFVIYVLALL